jgi:hypothetical protein
METGHSEDGQLLENSDPFWHFRAMLALLSPSLLRSRVRNFGLVLDGDGVNRRSPEGSLGFL